MKILAVDDSSTLRKIVAMTMKPLGHGVEEAENGKEALEKMATQAFDCIILDINMPVMGGMEFLTEKKQNPAIAAIPVIVLTTQDEEPLRDKAKSLGAKAFLSKPFDKDQLLTAINQSLV